MCYWAGLNTENVLFQKQLASLNENVLTWRNFEAEKEQFMNEAIKFFILFFFSWHWQNEAFVCRHFFS